MSKTIQEIAREAVALARKKGAGEAAARIAKAREIEVQWRDGKLEKLQEATTRGLSLQLYVDGRYSSVSTSDLRPEALDKFLDDAIALTRTLAKDPFRALPDPVLYKGQSAVDLQLEDPRYTDVTPEERRKRAQALEAAARSVKGAEGILSVTSFVSDTLTESFRVHSNGFEGSRRDTAFWMGASVSVKDADGRRPEDGAYAGMRFFGSLPPVDEPGRLAATRALSRLGARKGDSAVLTMAVDNRAAGRLVGAFGGALSAASLQQKRSFLEGKLGQQVGSPLFDVTDDPFVPRGFGSRLFDGEGLAARRLPVVEAGVLSAYYVDTYYGKKLGMAPTTAGTSNLAWKLGGKTQAQLLSDLKEGILVTGFLGGNVNGATGDFSHGVQGFRVRNGQIAEPIAEMNVAGNHLELWKHLVGVGNDPYPYSSLQTPTLVFEGVQFAGN